MPRTPRPVTVTRSDVYLYVNGAMSDEYDYRVKGDHSPVDVVEDPLVAGCFAVRFTNHDDRTVNLMFQTQHVKAYDAAEVLGYCLEEVEFTTWPPTSGALSFL